MGSVRLFHPRHGKSARVREYIYVPFSLLIVGKMLWWLVRHPMVLGVIVLWFVLWVWGDFSWTNAALTIVFLALALVIGWLAYIGRGVEGVKRWMIVKKRWPFACESVGLVGKESGRWPDLRGIRGTEGGVIGDVALGSVGLLNEHLSKKADDIAELMGARRATVHKLKPGLSRLTLLWSAEEEFLATSLASVVPGDQTRIILGRTPTGPAIFNLLQSLLVVGKQHAGKSNIIRAFVFGLKRQNVSHKLHVVDPAGGVELSELEHYEHTVRYVDRAAQVEGFIHKCYDDMNEKLRQMKERKLKLAPIEWGIDYIVIDELLMLRSQLSKGVDSEFGEILSVGRKAKWFVVAGSQLSQVDVLGRLRDLFPQRICLATVSPDVTDAALGEGAEAAGAKCSRISEGSPGVGFYYRDEETGYHRFRAGLAQDMTYLVGEASPPTEQVAHKKVNRKCSVYRLYDSAGNLLYVGKAFNPDDAFKRHASSKLWWLQVDHQRTRIEWYSSEDIALEVEARAIKTENPRHNYVHAEVVR